MNIFTPEKQFDSGEYTSFVCRGLDGEICIMRGHMPMILAVDVGVAVLTDGSGEKHTAVCGSGFLEVRDNELNAFFDCCQWETDIEHAKEEANRIRLAEQESIKEHRRNAIELARTVASLSMTQKPKQQ